MKYYFLGWMLLLGFAQSCNRTAKQPESRQSETGDENSGLIFVFSKMTPATVASSGDNLCRTTLPEPAVMNADPANANRRLFTLSEGPHKVTVDFGNIVATFVLQKTGNQVALFTSDNYPECLSNKANFSIGADGTTFHYDNHKHISFDVQLVPLPNGTQIALEMAPDAGYGILVRR